MTSWSYVLGTEVAQVLSRWQILVGEPREGWSGKAFKRSYWGIWSIIRSFPEGQGREKHSTKKEQHVWRNGGRKQQSVLAFTHLSLGAEAVPYWPHRGVFFYSWFPRLRLRIAQWAHANPDGARSQACFGYVDGGTFSFWWWEWPGALCAVFSHFVESDITVHPSLGHTASLALSQNGGRRHPITRIPSSPHLSANIEGSRGEQSVMRGTICCSSGTTCCEIRLPLGAERCDLEKALTSLSLSVPLGIKHVGQTVFNRHA